ncbi:MAG: UDP-glucose 4-epimerase GalE [Patescibacteria group bacterium]|nr:UDP-glucose 4-epimerase GalE [Patescibacteria group bacterium]
MRIFITGGAGYIGSHIVKELLKEKHQLFIYDNLSKGHRQAILGGFFIKGDLKDKNKLDQILKKYQPKVTIHLAGFIEVGESMLKPEKYFQNNVLNGLNLLEAMIKNKIKFIIFSSSAAVYQPQKLPLKENSPLKPTNVYGQTKYLFEKLLACFEKNYGLKFISLRYFNAAGADPSGRIGEDHCPETHLIPNILKVALGQKRYFKIFGDDYPTPDGTCIRDYIHVNDLAQAHILALKFLIKNKKSKIYNLGSEKGFSVKEVLEKCRLITQQKVPAKVRARRIGDSPILIASSTKIKKELGWQPKHSDLETIIKTAWQFYQNYPFGYKK